MWKTTSGRLAFRTARASYEKTHWQRRVPHRGIAHINSSVITIHPEVDDALKTGRPVVALESAVITHGLPAPLNLQTALSLQEKVRSTGSVPATVAILSGKIHVGLTDKQLETLSEATPALPRVKVSRRDLGPIVSSKLSGGTTVAATMIIAHLAGIHFFATGGLGGVHRGGEASMDISADLTELGRTPVGVVAAGCKAILDIPRTLEYLETQGVPVVSLGASDDFPAFYTAKSGYKAPWRADTPKQAADMFYRSQLLGLSCGTVFAAPIPDEHAAAAAIIQDAIEQAIRESEASGISKLGKDVTPWLLRRVDELSKGEAIRSNIALLENCALVAGRIAREYRLLSRQKEADVSTSSSVPVSGIEISCTTKSELSAAALRPVVVVGAAAVDITARLESTTDFASSSTLPGAIRVTLGGVARNMSEVVHRMLQSSGQGPAAEALLLAPIADDTLGHVLKEGLQRIGQRTDGLLTLNGVPHGTAVCNMVLDIQGNLIGGVADTIITEQLVATEILEQLEQHEPSVVGFDANLRADTMSAIMSYCRQHDVPALFEPTSIAKCSRILSALPLLMADSGDAILSFMTPNSAELEVMYQAGRSSGLFSSSHWWTAMNRMNLDERYRNDMDALCRLSSAVHPLQEPENLRFLITEGISQMMLHFLPFVGHLLVKLGVHGVVVAMRLANADAKRLGWHDAHTSMAHRQVVAVGNEDTTVVKHFPAEELPESTSTNVTGAGDAFAGVILAGLHRSRGSLSANELAGLIQLGQRAAVLTMQSDMAVAPDVSKLAAGTLLHTPRGP